MLLRLITAVFLITLTLLFLFFLSDFYFAFISGIFLLVAAYEWTTLMGLKKQSQKFIYLLIILASFIAASFFSKDHIFFVSTLLWLGAFCLIVIYPKGSEIWGTGSIYRGMMGIGVITPFWLALNVIHKETNGVYSLLYLFLLIWGADTSAYLIGKKWGKHKLAPIISPGKTLEGVYAALFFTISFSLLLSLILKTSLSSLGYCVLTTLCIVGFSIIGDLFESMLKRRIHLKDSSHLLPGHGGILDRIDSLTAATPIYVFMNIYLIKCF